MTPTTNEQKTLMTDLETVWHSVSDDADTNAAYQRLKAALTRQEARQEMSPEFTDSARAALAWVLFHHQGGSSPVGQAIRFALGMGQHEQLPEWRIAEAKQWAALTGATTAQFHVQQEAQGAVRYVRWHPKHGFNWKALDDEPYGANENWRSVALFTTPPAPVDVDVDVDVFRALYRDMEDAQKNSEGDQFVMIDPVRLLGWVLALGKLAGQASAPVDVRKLLSVVARMESYATDQENDPILIPPSRIRSWASDIRALLDSQPAEMAINPKDVTVEPWPPRPSPGGQHVGTGPCGVKVTHKPSGLVVCFDRERSQHHNRQRAMAFLQAALGGEQQEVERG